MKDRDEVIKILRRAFNGGVMRRLPKKRSDAQVLMALAMVGFDPNTFYDETEVNRQLLVWLDVIGSDDGVADYVTLRRELVDFGFLRRASDGAVYRVVPERIDAVLAPGAKGVDPKRLFAEVQIERRERRNQFRSSD